MIKLAIKLLRLKHVNNYMGIYFPHQPYNIIHLIGRNYRVKHNYHCTGVNSPVTESIMKPLTLISFGISG